MVPPTPEGLAEGMSHLLTNPDLRKQYGSSGRRRFKERFGITRFRKGLLEVFASSEEDLAAKRRL
jgi:glycosyltransferase involved in cell wall biosynthesis